MMRHPIEAAEHEVEHLKQIADEGKSAATPVIVIGAWIVVVIPLVGLVVALAFLVPHVV